MSKPFRGAQLAYGYDLGVPRNLYHPYGLVPHWLDDPDEVRDAAHRLLLTDAGHHLAEHDDPVGECAKTCGVELIEHDSDWHTQWLLTATYTTAAFGEATDIEPLTVPEGADTALARALTVLHLPIDRPPGWLLTCWDGN